jgi:hypothetical protein
MYNNYFHFKLRLVHSSPEPFQFATSLIVFNWSECLKCVIKSLSILTQLHSETDIHKCPLFPTKLQERNKAD